MVLQWCSTPAGVAEKNASAQQTSRPTMHCAQLLPESQKKTRVRIVHSFRNTLVLNSCRSRRKKRSGKSLTKQNSSWCSTPAGVAEKNAQNRPHCEDGPSVLNSCRSRRKKRRAIPVISIKPTIVLNSCRSRRKKRTDFTATLVQSSGAQLLPESQKKTLQLMARNDEVYECSTPAGVAEKNAR